MQDAELEVEAISPTASEEKYIVEDENDESRIYPSMLVRFIGRKKRSVLVTTRNNKLMLGTLMASDIETNLLMLNVKVMWRERELTGRSGRGLPRLNCVQYLKHVLIRGDNIITIIFDVGINLLDFTTEERKKAEFITQEKRKIDEDEIKRIRAQLAKQKEDIMKAKKQDIKQELNAKMELVKKQQREKGITETAQAKAFEAHQRAQAAQEQAQAAQAQAAQLQAQAEAAQAEAAQFQAVEAQMPGYVQHYEPYVPQGQEYVAQPQPYDPQAQGYPLEGQEVAQQDAGQHEKVSFTTSGELHEYDPQQQAAAQQPIQPIPIVQQVQTFPAQVPVHVLDGSMLPQHLPDQVYPQPIPIPQSSAMVATYVPTEVMVPVVTPTMQIAGQFVPPQPIPGVPSCTVLYQPGPPQYQ